MQIAISPELQQKIAEKVKAGVYPSAQAMIEAGIVKLLLEAEDFQPGELDALLAEGEQSIAADGTLDGDEAFAARRARRAARPGPRG